jgi:hypothetical protein
MKHRRPFRRLLHFAQLCLFPVALSLHHLIIIHMFEFFHPAIPLSVLRHDQRCLHMHAQLQLPPDPRAHACATMGSAPDPLGHPRAHAYGHKQEHALTRPATGCVLKKQYA